MFEGITFPTEIVLKSDAKANLPHGMAAADHIYLVENIRPGTNFMRICAAPDGNGEHTTIHTTAMNLKATMACW